MMKETMDLDIGANLDFDEELVPDDLKHLIPLAKRWGFNRPSEQDDFIKAMKRERPEELTEFSVLYDQNREAIREWETSLDTKHLSEMTEEDWRHPRWAFVSLYKVRELTGPATDPEEIKKIGSMKARHAKEIRTERYKAATEKADDAFRHSDFASYVEILSPFEDLLSPVQLKKLSIAVKQNSKR